jgi:hypothetical protein
MSLAFSVIRCAPRRVRWSLLTRLTVLTVASAACGWVLALVKGGAL